MTLRSQGTSPSRDYYAFALGGGALSLTIIVPAVVIMLVGLLGPERTSEAQNLLGLTWQVHAAFASIGFAGLAIAFQVLGEPPLSAGSARKSVVEHLRFKRLLVSGVTSNIVIGSVTVWTASPATLALAFALVLLPSVAVVALAYARLAHLFATPQRIEQLTVVELETRLSRAVETASKQEAAAQQTVERVDRERGLVSGSLADQAGLPLRRVTFPRYRGSVSNIKVGPMVYAADLLSLFAAGTDVGYDYPQRISVRARPNREYRPGDVLFEMHLWPDVSDDHWDAVDRYLMASLEIADDTAADARRDFADEMASLQDSVLARIRDQQLAGVKRGYQYHHEVIHEARMAGETGTGLRDPHWFERQLWELDVAAARSTDRLALVAIADALAMASAAIKTIDLRWLQVAVVRLQHIWAALLEGAPIGASNAQENLLVSLQNLAEFVIPHSVPGNNEAVERSARMVIWAFAEIAKEALEAGQLAVAGRALNYLAGLYDLGQSESARKLGVDVAAGQAVVLAWILYIRERRDSHIAVDLNFFARRHLQPDLAEVLRAYQERQDEAPWRNWEIRTAIPLRAQSLEFDTYVRRAVLLLAAAGRLTIRASNATVDDRFLLQGAAAAFDEVTTVWIEAGQDQKQLETARRQIDRVVEDLEQLRRDRLAQTPLSKVSVREFYNAVIETVGNGGRLREFLRFKIDPVDHSVPQAAHEEVPFGHVLSGIGREAFVDGDDVARAEQVGRQVGAMILRHQNHSLLRLFLANSADDEVDAAEVRPRTALLASAMSDPVILYNGQSEFEELLGLDFDGMKVRLAGLPAFALYIDGVDLVDGFLLLDRSRIPRFGLAPEPNDNLKAFPQVGLAIGVRIHPDPKQDPGVVVEYGQILAWEPSDFDSIHVRVTPRITRPRTHMI